MDPMPPARDEARFDLCIGRAGRFAKRTETTLVLTDEGIDYRLDSRSGLRPYAGLKVIQIQITSPEPHLAALVQLHFARGWPLVVHSSMPDGGMSPERSRTFVAFLTELHRRLAPQDRARIAFRSGVSRIRHIVLSVGAVMIAAPVVFLLLLTLLGRVPIAEAIWPLIPAGLLAAGFIKLAIWTRPGTYSPDRLPDGLLPP
jgi:hypothetical protein